jgi:hypothetical protein
MAASVWSSPERHNRTPLREASPNHHSAEAGALDGWIELAEIRQTPLQGSFTVEPDNLKAPSRQDCL